MRKYSWIAVLTLAADLVTKQLARAMSAPQVLIPGVLGLRYAENTGMAFSLFSGMPWVLGVVSIVLVIGGALILRRYRLGPWSRAAAMLILGGAIGNGIERLFTGYVVDMIEVLAFRFAIFNVADAALCIGCGLMAVSLLIRPDEWRYKHDRNPDGNAA